MIQRNGPTTASAPGDTHHGSEGGALDVLTSTIAVDRREDAYELEYDPATDAPSQAVVAAVGAVTETDPIELEPLHAAVDGDALDALFQPPTGTDRRVDFRYNGHEIVLETPGTVTVTETTAEADG
ncbi:HalOD1 output domain-containing protein [Natronococcus occultus]|uniref:Halobacterial output domain-containing protein n=1 Tax=Natronococcus occultus SP4 TaxID=694430 RepID=L0K095_9EURY|nr:HalOD1 output domain-containing protein [Natronococcus occultus]AGB37769.1 hypothetical protein Natoc_1979 [Natronococcus occultus SP4]